MCERTYDYRTPASLTGQLTEHTYPGPPNFQDIRTGDAPERGYYLALPAPVCVRSPRESDAEPDPAAAERRDVRYVQLVVDSATRVRLDSALRQALGRQVTVEGTLFSSYTGHHHAPLLLEVRGLAR